YLRCRSACGSGSALARRAFAAHVVASGRSSTVDALGLYAFIVARLGDYSGSSVIARVIGTSG
ncbi:MAG: hypothetical protein ABJE66_35445, partial [Deltaproteobacteria bacterium]